MIKRNIGISALILTVGVLSYWGIQKSSQKTTVNEEHPGWYDHYYELKGDENGNIPSGLTALWYKADQNNLLSYKKAENNLEKIKEIGPDNVGGRTRSIIIDIANSNRYLCASVSGGIWVSDDQGSSWNVVDDNAPTLSSTSITQSPFDTDVFYYGTGEPTGNSADLGGLGIFKSTDGATSFLHLEHTMTTSFSGVWDIKHSLTKDSTIYVATHTSGVWISTNAGNSFSRITQLPSGRIYELEVRDDGYLFAVVSGYGIVKMNENDFSVERLNGGDWPSTGYGRISFAMSADFPDVMYAQVAASSNNSLLGIFKTSNGGTTWKQVSSPSEVNFSFSWYCFKLSMAPADTNFIISLSSTKPQYSNNNGSSWFNMSNPHSDYHEVTWIDNNEFLVGNDGGVFRMNKNSMAAFTNLNNGLNITQFYAGHYYPEGNSIIGGTQDNGTRFSVQGNSTFSRIWGADGSFCAVNQQNDQIRYVSSQNLNMYRQDVTGSNYISSYIRNQVGGDAGVWFISPFEVNINDGYQIYVPTRRETYRSLDGGNTWEALTKNLLGDSYAVGLSNDEDPTAYIGGTSSRLYRVDNAASAGLEEEVNLWTTQYPNFLGSTIGCIEVDPNDKGTIYCGLTNVSTRSRIWKIVNADTDDPIWYDLSSNLPESLPVNWVEVDPDMSNHIIIATDYGLYSSLNGGASWNKEERLPNVPIDQIRLRASDRKLFIYTHGRGIWTANLKSNLVASVNETEMENIHIYPNPVSKTLHIDTQFDEYSLYDNKGTKVLSNNTKSLDISSLPVGTYFIELFTEGEKHVKKILITH
ncbi:MAG: hypothetical protein COA58_12355 [Bacteroidetes bacterium]|nr:MAG: hypothetical protein COA58_12355 [Bacteroidota bacterium]